MSAWREAASVATDSSETPLSVVDNTTMAAIAVTPAVLSPIARPAAGKVSKRDRARFHATEFHRAYALAALAPYLSKTSLLEALAVAKAIAFLPARFEALAAVVPYLSKTERGVALREALVICDHRLPAIVRARGLMNIAPHLPETLLFEAFQKAKDIVADRPDALAAFAPYLPELHREAAIRDGLLASKTSDQFVRASVLTVLAPHLPEALFSDALAGASAISSKALRARTLAALCSYLPKKIDRYPILLRALDDAQEISDSGYDPYRAHALAELAPRLPNALIVKAMRIAESIASLPDSANAVVALAPYVTDFHRDNILHHALTKARTISDLFDRIRTVATLVPSLSRHQRRVILNETLVSAKTIADPFEYARTIATLAPYLRKTERENNVDDALLKISNVSVYTAPPSNKKVRSPNGRANLFVVGQTNVDARSEYSISIEYNNNSSTMTEIEFNIAKAFAEAGLPRIDERTSASIVLILAVSGTLVAMEPHLLAAIARNTAGEASRKPTSILNRAAAAERLLKACEEQKREFEAAAAESGAQLRVAYRLLQTYKTLRKISVGVAELAVDDRLRAARALAHRAEKLRP
jgi:hypothetical protein